MINENVFYLHVKISNMSPTIWLKEALNDKKRIKSTLKNCQGLQKKDSTENVITPDIIAELKMITLENVKLQNENALLQDEYSSLKKENANLLVNIQKDQEKFEEQIKKLIDEVKINKNNFIESKQNIIIQKKKFMEEVKSIIEFCIVSFHYISKYDYWVLRFSSLPALGVIHHS